MKLLQASGNDSVYRCERKLKSCSHSLCSFVFKLIFCKKGIFRDPQAPIKIFEGTQPESYSSVWWNCFLACANHDGEQRKEEKGYAKAPLFWKKQVTVLPLEMLCPNCTLKPDSMTVCIMEHHTKPAPTWFTQFKVSLYSFRQCMNSTKHRATLLWPRRLAQVLEVFYINTEHSTRATEIFAVSDVPCSSL